MTRWVLAALGLLGAVGADGCVEPAAECEHAVDEAVRRWRGHLSELEHDAGTPAARVEAAHRVLVALQRSADRGWAAAQGYPLADAPASFRDVWASTRGAALACEHER